MRGLVGALGFALVASITNPLPAQAVGDVDTIDDLQALVEASTLDAKKPKRDQSFSSRTAGALQLLAKRLRSRA